MTDDVPTTEFAGIRFQHADLASATSTLLAAQRAAVPWRLINTHNVALLHENAEYAATLRAPGVNLADGKPVAWALKWLSRGFRSAPDHVRGPALFARVLDEGRTAGVSHYLLGGTPETLEALVEAVAARFPGARIAGAESPPFRPLTDEEREAQNERIRRSGADIVWVGLGAPRQDVEASRIAASVSRPVVAVGAAFDFLAGTRREAPVWAQRLALEWLYRWVNEPRRLARRYTVGLGRFALVAARELVRRRRTAGERPRGSAASGGERQKAA